MTQKSGESSLPRRMVRNTSRAATGGGALLIGLALFLLFRGFGPGGTGETGAGTDSDSPENSSSGAEMISVGSGGTALKTERQPVNAPEETEGGLNDLEKRALAGDVVSVLIDEHEYFLEVPGDEVTWVPVSLERAAELAKLSRGDTNGIRVRILRRESSRASAEFQLRAELERRGISRDSLIMPSEFVQ